MWIWNAFVRSFCNVTASIKGFIEYKIGKCATFDDNTLASRKQMCQRIDVVADPKLNREEGEV